MPEKQSQLSVAREDFQQYVRKSVDGARALRDEWKLKAQAGTEEAKAHWGELERYFAHLDTVAHDLNQAAGAFGERLLSIARRAAPKRGRKRAAKAVARSSVKRGGKKRASKKRAAKKRTRR